MTQTHAPLNASPNLTAPQPTREAQSRFPAVQRLIKEINALPKRDSSPDEGTAEFIVQSLAHENGFKGLWTPEERAIGAALIQLQLGPRAAHYGWRLYKRYRATACWDVDRIEY